MRFRNEFIPIKITQIIKKVSYFFQYRFGNNCGRQLLKMEITIKISSIFVITMNEKRGNGTGCLEWRKSLQEGASGLDPEQGTPDGITTRGEHVMVQRVQNSRASIHVSTSVFWPSGKLPHSTVKTHKCNMYTMLYCFLLQYPDT